MWRRTLEFKDNCYNSTHFWKREIKRIKREIKRNNYAFVWIIRQRVIRRLLIWRDILMHFYEIKYSLTKSFLISFDNLAISVYSICSFLRDHVYFLSVITPLTNENKDLFSNATSDKFRWNTFVLLNF